MKASLALCGGVLLFAGCTSTGGGARTTPPPVNDAAERARIAGEAVRTAPRRAPAWRCTPVMPSPMPSPATRAERTGYCETTPYEEAMAFLDTVRSHAAVNRVMRITRIGASPRGRPLMAVTACSRIVRGVESCDELMTESRLRPVVLLQANIHAGEVEGKEAVLALLRTVVTDAGPNLLDSLTLVVIPMYNADGNEALGPQSRNRGAQLGPAVVGERPNGDGLDLNRDYIKAEAPETRAMLPMLSNGSIDVFVDLHTTNGSYHGYNLTWSPSLHPGAPLATFTSDTLLAGVRARLDAHGTKTYAYGNFSNSFAREVSLDPVKEGWFTYDSRPRFGSNYFGLTGGVSVLSEAYSHDPFELRVRSTAAFIRELLGTIGADPSIFARINAARRALVAGVAPKGVVLETQLTTRPRRDAVLVEELAADRDSAGAEPGVPPGIRRTGRIAPQQMAVHDRFDATRTTGVPAGGWLVEARDTALLALLDRHGVVVRPRMPAAQIVTVERFELDSVERAPRPFQGHREVRVLGRWVRARLRPTADFRWVPATQRQLLLAAQLLEPQSSDGATTWNLFDDRLLMGKYHPVMRVTSRAATR
ncbi:MAG TPA: M14 family zinc carboxypeptidase [Gemmatimonadaceae bacterium]|nr:M14 family zinc carboxypeptidase [Gemmatimonadaceae bacterium]